MIAWALKKSLHNYSFGTFKSDLVAGLIVSLVALPLAMALAIAVGLPPQYGLYTAVASGISVPLLGGSYHQVSGPTAAFVVIIAPIVSNYGIRGLIITTILAGIILIMGGLLKLGRYIQYIPYPVTTGFTSGIALVIAVLSLNDFLGLAILKLPDHFLSKVAAILTHLPQAHWQEMLVGIVTLALMLIPKKKLKQIPSPILGIGVGTLLSCILNNHGYDIATIGSRFSYSLKDGNLAHGIPPYLPTFAIPGLSSLELFKMPTLHEIRILTVPALVISILAALESLLSAAVADGMAGTKHNPNAELIGIGWGNILSGLASGMPATGAIARTATNIQSGGKTPIASSLHAIFILLYLLFFTDYISFIPMASLAALLLLTAYRMSHVQQFIRILRIGPIEDSLVLVICFLFTAAVDMVAGVTAGIILACFLLVKRISTLTQLKISHTSKKSNTETKFEKEFGTVPNNTIIYHINGSLFFGNVEQILGQIEIISPQINTIIIDLSGVPFLDMTGMIAIKEIILNLAKNGKTTILSVRRVVMGKILEKTKKIPPKFVHVTDNLKEALNLAKILNGDISNSD